MNHFFELRDAAVTAAVNAAAVKNGNSDDSVPPNKKVKLEENLGKTKFSSFRPLLCYETIMFG